MPNNDTTVSIKNVELVRTAGLINQFPTDKLPQIALSGRSNVGKSSLVNKLIDRKSLARVSGSPGKTITINFYRLNLNGGKPDKLYLVDLPGYGFAKRPHEEREKWLKLTDAYFTSGEMRAVVQLVDLKVGVTSDDEMMFDYMNANSIPYFVVATKTDKLNKTNREIALSALRENPYIPADAKIIPFSSLTGEGKDECLSEIFTLAGV